ncbi:potassium transporter [Rickettsiales endosymbiont of Peranema trichophorum]|uniref:monovalent cation:proton antiporter-2 (CPA2) family protein n=1 Tax=Rickettsiales endosymbiont of Peranema trichophorum TaxID=2486577 RepID=UPI001022CE2A|nr:monovalent cation:proton antiporter-2 (CPA2) family protein [Rickettsiales endosymbiont of Peranema trichophorum]RZI47197.1 potassium transporter [Rickettsiales endosymbiont of Peranema trichophorum]
MEHSGYLADVLILLSASVFIVVVSKKLRLSPVLGYLIVGTAIGEHGLNLIEASESSHYLAEFGVVFLLFVIGLELSFERLIQMRAHVFGFGGLQLLLTTCAIAMLMNRFYKMDISVMILVSAAFALSSTAIVLQVLAENKRQSSQVGRLSLAVLVMQDFAVVPLLAILPIITQPKDDIINAILAAGIKAVIAIIIITLAGRLLLRPFFTVIGSVKSEEVFVSTTLLLVLAAASLTNELGLSTATGAFIAGILIAETEYRNKVENNILPFKSLLLGLFFMTVGMTINVDFILQNLSKVFVLSSILLLIKGFIIFILSKIFRFRTGAAIHSGLLLSQGGEFAFVLFGLAAQQSIIGKDLAQLLYMVVAVTMAVTPLLSIVGAYIEDRLDLEEELEANQAFKGVSDLSGHVIVAGFGRVGRVVAYMLSQEHVNYIAVDSNYALVKKTRDQGFPIYHGDLAMIDILQAVGTNRAAAIILTMGDKLSIRKAIKTIRANFKNLDVIVRVEDYKHGKQLQKLGATAVVPSTIETGLQLGGALLKLLKIPEHETLAMKEMIRQNDYLVTEEMELFRGMTSRNKSAESSKDDTAHTSNTATERGSIIT